jgi:hypothetical protein
MDSLIHSEGFLGNPITKAVDASSWVKTATLLLIACLLDYQVHRLLDSKEVSKCIISILKYNAQHDKRFLNLLVLLSSEPCFAP